MDVRELVQQHYGAADLTEAILAALAAAGVDQDRLTPADLFPVDQLHAGGVPQTQHLLERIAPSAGARLLDVGCGVGGPSRFAAASYDVRVTGIDLTPEFTQTATELTARVGLAERATFVATAGESLTFDDDSLDAAMMIHVGMNIPDKASVFAEVHRVLAPGARFGMFEQMRTGPGDLPYPLPWAEDERSSFVETSEEYAAHLTAAGFTVLETEDRTATTMGPGPAGPVTPMTIFGPAFAERVGNNVTASRAGQLGAVLLLAEA